MLQLARTRLAESKILLLGVLTTTLLAAALLLAVQPARAATTFVVDSTADYGDQTPGDGKCDTGTIMLIGEHCTLRAAIEEANAFAGADTINFDITGTGVRSIAPTSQLPKISRPVTINGYSQPGARPNTKAFGSDAILRIELSGAGVQNGYGLVLGGANSIVSGLVIDGWNQGIRIDGSGATGNRISGNFIGTDASGTIARANNVGVRLYYGSDTTIGGTAPAARNVISGNAQNGLGIGDGVAVKDTTILGNYVGTGASGTQDLGNAYAGIGIEDAPGTTVGGTTASERNVVSGNGQEGIGIYSNGTKVLGNYVGIDATGTKDMGNSREGVTIFGSNNTIGGTMVGARNVISGNDESGIRIDGAFATGNKVSANFIGTDKNGTASLGNTYDGVRLYEAPNNTVGGTTAGERNVISGNNNTGVLIFGATADGNRVSGNFIGTDVSGTRDRGNRFDGVTIESGSNNTVGGTTTGERNVISGNGSDGVGVEGTEATGNKVQGNFLGVDKNGAALGNSARGVFVYDSPNNTVGGAASGAGNVISGNFASGVGLFTGTATGDRILSNSIYNNGGLGIDLADDGPTANDPGDLDAGPNYLQNHPVLTSARKSATGTTTIRGKLDSTPSTTFKVELFSNPEGGDEGKTLLGSRNVSTDGSGNVSFTFSTNKTIKLGQNITATATSPGGSTSEFSVPVKVVAR